MCQIIVKEAGQKFDMKKLDKAQGWNEDGYGVTWFEGKQLQTFKTMDYNRFKAILSTLKKHKAVAHLRNTTRGTTCLDNNHPFPIPSGMMFHNGTISGLTCSTAGGSDTKKLAELLNDCEYNVIDDIAPLLQNIIGDTINRLVFFEDDGEITIINEDLGQYEDGIWYSNDYHTRADKRGAVSSSTYTSDFLKTHEWDKTQGRYVKRKVIEMKKKDEDRLTKVFVYGTLKEGQGNHKFFLSKAKKVGKATSVAKWAMIGKDMSFPYLLGRDNEDGLKIEGEVYAVTDEELAQLDRLEGVPTHYKKSYMYVSYMDGKPSENAMVYVKTVPTVADYAQPYISNFTKKAAAVKEY